MSTWPNKNERYEEISALDVLRRKVPWYRKLTQRMGLQVKLVIAFMFTIMLTMTLTVLTILQDNNDGLEIILAENARQIATSIASTSSDDIAALNVEQFSISAKRTLSNFRNILFISAYRPDGTLLCSEARDQTLHPPTTEQFSNLESMRVRVVNTRVYGDINVIFSPVSTAKAGMVGFVQMGLSRDVLQQQTKVIVRNTQIIGLAMCLLALPMAWMMVRRIFLPIRQLVKAAKQIASGDMNTTVDSYRPDAIGDLARAFNEMAKQIRYQQHELRCATDQVVQQNKELEQKIEQRTAQIETAKHRLSAEVMEKEDFLRAISHDLNAPLRNISGMVTMLLTKKKDSFDEDTLHRLDRVKKNVEVQSDLIHELLELSRIKSRRMVMEEVHTEAMIWELRGMFENDLKTRRIELIIDTALPNIYCEKARFRQVFQNLIDNAIKYMGDGMTKEIHVGCQTRLSEAEFYVRDTGLGIESEDVDKVFFIFRRGRNQATQQVAGKGVGLASVKSIIENYNGKIWVESELCKGSTFRFTVNGQYLPSSGSFVLPKQSDDEESVVAA